MRVAFVVIICLCSSMLKAGGPFDNRSAIPLHILETGHADFDLIPFREKENSRFVAAMLTIALGPLGGHRLYLGTKPGIPMLYVATLGGGFFILPLIDLGHILFSKDLSRFKNNERVFMWRGA